MMMVLSQKLLYKEKLKRLGELPLEKQRRQNVFKLDKIMSGLGNVQDAGAIFVSQYLKRGTWIFFGEQ